MFFLRMPSKRLDMNGTINLNGWKRRLWKHKWIYRMRNKSLCYHNQSCRRRLMEHKKCRLRQAIIWLNNFQQCDVNRNNQDYPNKWVWKRNTGIPQWINHYINSILNKKFKNQLLVFWHLRLSRQKNLIVNFDDQGD